MPQRHRLLAIALASLILFYIYFSHFSHLNPISPYPAAALPPADSTLGFGAIIAVSHSRSPRRSSLLWAANLTDIDIVIPGQPEWSDADVAEFRSGGRGKSEISTGSAKAWMGHLNALHWFLGKTELETALIIEDDIDFSLSLRHTQIPLLAEGMRRLFKPNSLTSTSSRNMEEGEEEAYGFWGPLDAWDILYPGHCDDFPSPLYIDHTALLYHDANSPSHASLHPATQHFLTYLNVPPKFRLIHRALYPFCTFAYAVTRRSAMRIVEQFSKEKEGGISAFDVQLLEACRDGWRCWSVVPEIFHHGNAASEIFRADKKDYQHREQDQDVSRRTHEKESEEGEMVEVEQEKGFARATWNIECGARSDALWVEEGDERGREEVKRVVKWYVERGECPIVRVGEKWWIGCEEGECGGQS